MLRDQVFLPIQLAPGGSLQGCCEASEPLLLASRPLAWIGWGGVVVVKVSFLSSGPQTSLLVLGIFPACPATLEPLMDDLQSLLKGGGCWLPA